MLAFCTSFTGHVQGTRIGTQVKPAFSKRPRNRGSNLAGCTNATCTQNGTRSQVKRAIHPHHDARLILAPMEVLADYQFRKAIATIGGMDEAVHEFLRITRAERSHIHGILRNKYDSRELGTIPLAAQIMGGDPEAMALATNELAKTHGAHRIDLNCGCPSRRVNGNGAGASLLQTPDIMFKIVKGMVEAAQAVSSGTIVSVKMRSGFDSIELFDDNVRAVMEAGASMITVHPRTKVQAYKGNADWSLIKFAKDICGDRVEIVGNGDVNSAEDALKMLKTTGCDHVMVGRGAVANPWIFWEIREALDRYATCNGMTSRHTTYLEKRLERSFEMEKRFYMEYLDAGVDLNDRSEAKLHQMKIGRLKMMLRYSCRIDEEGKQKLLNSDSGGDARMFVNEILKTLERHYRQQCVVA